ncbi:MAG: putative porin [bacterium]
MKQRYVIGVSILVASVFVGAGLFAQDSGSVEKLKFAGDLRLRFEKDYEVSGKEDRDRARYRFRFGLVHKRGDHIEIGARLASGSLTDQQSPHQTFGDDFGKKNFYMDRAYFKYSWKSGWFWIGKNSFPFWKQNELFWDDDVNPEGVSASYSAKDFAGPGSKLTLTGGEYIIDNFNDLLESSVVAGQVSVNKKTGAVNFTAAAGLFFFNNNNGDTLSFNALNNMDHNILVVSAQVKFDVSPSLPVTVGADYMKNLEDPAVAGFDDETRGFVAQVSLGKLKAPGDWLFGAYYARIEKFAVVPNFAQDDWWRFGSGHTDSSDLKGFELRAAVQIGKKMNLVARHYVTEMIKGSKEANRFRLDLNVKY